MVTCGGSARGSATSPPPSSPAATPRPGAQQIGEALAQAEVSGDRSSDAKRSASRASLPPWPGDLATAIDVVMPQIGVARAPTTPPRFRWLSPPRHRQDLPGRSPRPPGRRRRGGWGRRGVRRAWTPTVLFGPSLRRLWRRRSRHARVDGRDVPTSVDRVGIPVDASCRGSPWPMASSGDVDQAAQTLDARPPQHHRPSSRPVATMSRPSSLALPASSTAPRVPPIGPLAATATGTSSTEVECGRALAGVATDLGSHDEAARLLGASSPPAAERSGSSACRSCSPPTTRYRHRHRALGAERYEDAPPTGAR